MKYTILNTYDALVQKARKIQQIARFLHPQKASSQDNQNYPGQSSIFFILDFTQSKFLYVDPYYQNLLQFQNIHPSPEDFAKRLHPNDLKVLHHHIIPDVVQFFYRQYTSTYPEFSISFNIRVRKSDNSYLSMMLRSNRILTSEKEKPLAITGFMIDISPFKEDSRMIVSIERRQAGTPVTFTTFRSVYFPDAKSGLLSNREMEILHHIGSGLCSKEIAEKLYISEFTVNNHRKKMLKKTGCRNTSELLKRMLQGTGR